MNTELATLEPGTVVLSRREVARFEPNEEQRRMIRATYANGASDDEFQVLMEIARARNLNPLLRQIHFVSRWQPGGNVWAPQVSIDGLRAIAERTGLYAGQDEPVYIDGPDGALLCCKVAVWRKDWTRPAVGVAYWNEYVQMTKDRATGKDRPAAMWAKMPHVMLAKVAESIALRKAFPEDAGGLYTDDEMGQADNGRPERDGAEEPKVTTTRARSKPSLPPQAEAPQLGAGGAEPASEEPKPAPAIPAELVAFHDGLPGVADLGAAAALWHTHRAALAAAGEARTAAWNELAKRTMKFGGGVASATAAKNALKDRLSALAAAETKSAVETPAEVPAEPVAAEAAPGAESTSAPESPAVEASPVEPSAQHPAVVAFLATVAAIELPGEGTVAWMKHRADLGPLPVADRELAWKALVARVETVGRMANAGPWLKKAVLAADANAQLAAEAAGEPAGLPGDVMDALLADLGTARDAATLSTTWAAIAEGEWHDATPAQRVRLESARTAREKALRTPPTPPRGTRSRTAAAPADANGSGSEAPANDVAGATMSTADRWRAHLAAKPRTGRMNGAGEVAASWVKHRDELTEAGARAECLAITIDELAVRGVAEPGAWLDGVREHRGSKAA